MGDTALKFGPEWLRALSHGNSAPASTMPETPPPKYKLAQYRYGREEMLALFSKELKPPEEIKEFEYLITDKCQQPLALQPHTDEEQGLWARSVNSDAALRGSGKGPMGPSNMRTGRGGSVDRGRGRGRGGYYQRGLNFDENDDGPPGGFSRLRTLERSHSVNDKDPRWDDNRDRRLDRAYSGRVGLLDDGKPESLRPSNDNWRRNDKDDEGGWRSNNRGDKYAAGRNMWRFNDRDRMRSDYDNKDRGPSTRDGVANGAGHNLPEWSVEEAAVSDGVGTFDATGAFMETKKREPSVSSEEIYLSGDESEGTPPKKKETPKSKPVAKVKVEPEKSALKDPPKSEAKVVKLTTQKVRHEKSPPTESAAKNKRVDKPAQIGPPVVPINPPKPVPAVVRTEQLKQQPKQQQQPVREMPATTDEDNFAHHIEATENMVAQWTKEEEQNTVSKEPPKTALPVHHEDAYKWFYQDPQEDIQGPFTSTEMCDWFKAGYFNMDLLIRRGCDEKFTQLGELMQTWGCMPFLPSANPPAPIRAPTAPIKMPIPLTSKPNPPVTAPQQQDPQLRLMQQQQQLFQLQMQQQMLIRQTQMQQLLMHLKQDETFAKMTPQQQLQTVQQLVAQQQQQQQSQVPRTNMGTDQPVLDSTSGLPFPSGLPLMGHGMPPMMKNDVPLWNAPTSGSFSLGQGPNQPPAGSIWDTDGSPIVPIEVSELEKQHKLAAEEEDKRRQQTLEAVKRLEEEKKKREEEERKTKEESERLLREIQRKQEEEQRRLEELRRLKEEEKQRQEEELKRLEEQRKEEERMLQEMRKKEESRKQEELRKLEEELKRKELLEELRKKEELEKQLREHERQLEMQRQQEERQKEQRALEMKMQEQQLRAEAEKQQQQQQQFLEMQQRREEQKLQELQRKEGPVWGIPNMNGPTSELSLSTIQKLQEEKEREDKERIKQIQLQQQIFFQQQQNLKQAQGNKNGLSWAKRATECGNAVKSLAEIQQEEAQQLAQQQFQKVQKTAASTVQVTVASGAWGATSQPSRTQSGSGWANTNSIWDDSLKNISAPKPTPKSGDSAFPALNDAGKSSSVNSNKTKIRAKREDNTYMKLFETHRKPTDEFTAWCTEALSNMPSSVDVPTFVAFLKDIESPYEVYDYVKSYLGEGKEAKDFGKQFLERRSKFRNQSKKTVVEDNLWGPAPAITPNAKPINSNDCDSATSTKGKAKKKKNKMQKLDSSMLGFMVQSNPDRLNVGEIDRGDGM